MRVQVGVLPALLLGAVQAISGQTALTPTVQVDRVELAHLVSAHITVLSPERDLVIPLLR